MASVHVVGNVGTCRNGFDIYQCTEDGAEPDDELIVLKHQQLFAIKENLDTKLLQNATDNEVIRKMNISMFNPTKFNKYVENLTLKGDSILKVTNFFEHIDAGLKITSSVSYNCMPHLSQLSATIGFREAILQQFSRRSHVFF